MSSLTFWIVVEVEELVVEAVVDVVSIICVWVSDSEEQLDIEEAVKEKESEEKIGLSNKESLKNLNLFVKDENIKNKVETIQWINLDLKDKKVLLIDEIDDTRKTLDFCVKKLRTENKAKDIWDHLSLRPLLHLQYYFLK